jgi:hypothetical protein
MLYLGFVALILTLVFTCVGEKVELESKDYYARELRYQEQLDAINNLSGSSYTIQHQVNGKLVEVFFPQALLSSGVTGSINFLRPSDSSKDKLFALKPDASGRQVFGSDGCFIKGAYKMQISFTSKGKAFYKEAIVNFQ